MLSLLIIGEDLGWGEEVNIGWQLGRLGGREELLCSFCPKPVLGVVPASSGSARRAINRWACLPAKCRCGSSCAQQVAAHPRGPGLGVAEGDAGPGPRALPWGCWLLASEGPFLAHFGLKCLLVPRRKPGEPVCSATGRGSGLGASPPKRFE